ncbi:MAG: DUF3108 domain-containing protein [Marinobacter sp.]|jgi:hypothetical protein|uniref:DUF3108 domain-containing protein n=1 Tax=Marinobacter salarius TaxID=1420917 RepID=W5YTM7_9GAMM|nr:MULTISPECIES: DUF3108 domain-containing protein [Marinobacter]AHI32239.1 hypothetical protein AU15_16290 [Marinobacter salarius]|tara:strand:- start:41 stop:781 length:741 start_codon:yes stop_codon:yes gene_type:complete
MPLKFSLTALPALLTGALLLGASLAQASDEQEDVTLQPMKLSYNASLDKGISLNGDARRILEQRDDGTWHFRTDVDSFVADIDESLIFRWEDNQVVPLRYRYKLSGLFIRDREEAIDFDWENNVVSGHHEGDKFSMKLEKGAMDPMGYQLQLSQDIKAGKREMEYRVIDKGDYDTDKFAVVDEETVRINGDDIRTLKAEKVRDSDSKRESLMWFAPERDYLLIRFLQVEPDGSEYELTISDAKVGR